MAVYTNGNLALQYKEKRRVVTQKKVTKKSGMPIGEKMFYLLTVVLIVTLASIVIAGYAQIAKYNYSIQNLEGIIKEVHEENDHLQLKIAELSAPDRILTIAQQELGMALNEQQVVVLSNTLN